MVLDLVAGKQKPAQIAQERGSSVGVLGSWKSQLVLNAHIVFESGSSDASKEQRIAELERLLGKQALELETAKKALSLADVQRQKGGL
jgi:hypothetical protein